MNKSLTTGILLLSYAILLCIGLLACGSSSDTPTESITEAEQSTTPTASTDSTAITEEGVSPMEESISSEEADEPRDPSSSEAVSADTMEDNTPEDADCPCGTKTTCSEMDSCEEATCYLIQCGLTRLDRDNDGIPCESLCES